MNKQWIIERLGEPSTWRGLVMLVSAAGVPVNPEYAEHIIAVGMALSGLIGCLTSDKKTPNSVPSMEESPN